MVLTQRTGDSPGSPAWLALNIDPCCFSPERHAHSLVIQAPHSESQQALRGERGARQWTLTLGLLPLYFCPDMDRRLVSFHYLASSPGSSSRCLYFNNYFLIVSSRRTDPNHVACHYSKRNLHCLFTLLDYKDTLVSKMETKQKF